MWIVKAYEYRTQCRPDHRSHCWRPCRISREWTRRQASPGRSDHAADRGRSRCEVRHRSWPDGDGRGAAMANVAGGDGEQQFYTPQRSSWGNDPDGRLDRTRSVYRRRTGPDDRDQIRRPSPEAWRDQQGGSLRRFKPDDVTEVIEGRPI